MGEYEFGLGAAQSLLCERPGADGFACGNCPACGWFSQGNHPDFRLLVPESLAPEAGDEAAGPPKKEKRSEQIRIEQVRELSAFLSVGTHRAGFRVILIYPADAMNVNTQNALLKALEEPPPESVFLLVTTRPESLLPTVRSRCMKFALPVPEPARALEWLKAQGVKRPHEALAAAGGKPLAALKAAETESDRSRFLEKLRTPEFDPITLAESVLRIPVGELVDWLQRWGQDLLLARLSGGVRHYPDHADALEALARRCEAPALAAYLRRLAEARALAYHPLNPKLFVESLLLDYGRVISGAPVQTGSA